jgi:hypothetical protein
MNLASTFVGVEIVFSGKVLGDTPEHRGAD